MWARVAPLCPGSGAPRHDDAADETGENLTGENSPSTTFSHLLTPS